MTERRQSRSSATGVATPTTAPATPTGASAEAQAGPAGPDGCGVPVPLIDYVAPVAYEWSRVYPEADVSVQEFSSRSCIHIQRKSDWELS